MMGAKEQVSTVCQLDKAEIATVKTVASRLKKSRELCGHQLNSAANLLGIKADVLQKIEIGIDLNTISLWLIERAAKVYDVSTDYLFGVAEDWELCEELRKERDFSAHLQNILIQKQAIVTAKLIEQNSQINALSNTVVALAPATKAVYDSILRFWELNQNFDEMPGGAAVIHHLDRADKAGHKATCQMVRSGLLPFEALRACQVIEPKTETLKTRVAK